MVVMPKIIIQNINMTYIQSKPKTKTKTINHNVNPDDAVNYNDLKKYSNLFYFKLLIILLLINILFFLFLTRQGAALEGGNDSPVLNEISVDKIILPNQKNNDNYYHQVSTIPVNSCYLWEFSNEADLKRAKIALANPIWRDFLPELAKAPPTFMVFLGPFTNSNQLNELLKQLKALDIQEYNILSSNELSLSVVNTRESALAFKQSLTTRGLQNVNVRERDSNKQRLRYRFNQLNIDRQQALIKIAGTLRQCDANLINI
jgi:hypothetical protein